MSHREDGTPQCASCQRLAPRCGLCWCHVRRVRLCGALGCTAAEARAACRHDRRTWVQTCREERGLYCRRLS